MVGIKKEGREAKRRRIAAGEEGIFRGEKRGKRGEKNVSR